MMNDLNAAASRWGIETEYHDVFGRRVSVAPETVTRLIEAMSAGGVEPRPAEPQPELMRAYQGDGRRLWGLAVQLYGVRSRRNWGHGDFGDLNQLIERAADSGAAAIGLNPLHALFPDRADQVSPYAPNSRLFLNLLYIDVERIPEFPGLETAGLASQVAALRETDLVDYAAVATAKLHGLRLAYARYRDAGSEQRRADFNAYRDVQGEPLLRFACFEVLRRHYAPAPWTEWPRPWRNPGRADLEEFRRAHAEEVQFEEFIQWNADRQLAACMAAAKRRSMGIGLYVDVAVGIDRHGADAWSNPGTALANVSIGAPPDEFNPRGQDWGLAPLNPHDLPAHDFSGMRQLMATAMRYAGAIRLDHVLGLQRVFMIPLGMDAARGAYVRMPFFGLLRAIAEESQRYRCIVIGEDLGTVPDRFRETISSWGVWSYRVMLFEREADGRFRSPQSYPEGALATFSTHDLPTFRGWLTKHDLAVKRKLGLDPGETDEARAEAQRRMREALGEQAGAWATDDFTSVAAFLGATPSRLVMVSLDDVLGVLDQANIPGTTTEHPNWRRKLPLAVEDLGGHDGLGRVTEAFAKAGRGN